MKIFSSLIAFVIMFACLSTAYADVAPRPRPRPVESQFVTASVIDNEKLSVVFKFPCECDYEYRLVDGAGNEILSGSGSCESGDTVKNFADVSSRLTIDENFFVLKIQMRNIKEPTRFGKKIRRAEKSLTKTIVVARDTQNNCVVRVYDGERA